MRLNASNMFMAKCDLLNYQIGYGTEAPLCVDRVQAWSSNAVHGREKRLYEFVATIGIVDV